MFKFLLKNKLKAPEELDNLYEILDYQNSWVEIRRKDDSIHSNNEEKTNVYSFKDGIKKFCFEQKIPLAFFSWDKCFVDYESIYSYLKSINCCDMVLGMLSDSAKMAKHPNKKLKLKKVSYDSDGNVSKYTSSIFVVSDSILYFI